MTDNQFEQKKKELREEMNSQGFGWINGKYIKPPKEYELRERELSCISMINSILAYNWFGESAEEIMQMEERGYKNYLAEYVALFSRKKVVELIQEQINSIKDIKRNVHTDGEGVSYNSIIWKEEVA
jgi:hypothetical protein